MGSASRLHRRVNVLGAAVAWMILMICFLKLFFKDKLQAHRSQTGITRYSPPPISNFFFFASVWGQLGLWHGPEMCDLHQRVDHHHVDTTTTVWQEKDSKKNKQVYSEMCEKRCASLALNVALAWRWIFFPPLKLITGDWWWIISPQMNTETTRRR